MVLFSIWAGGCCAAVDYNALLRKSHGACILGCPVRNARGGGIAAIIIRFLQPIPI